jgi:hypothetical protein
MQKNSFVSAANRKIRKAKDLSSPLRMQRNINLGGFQSIHSLWSTEEDS